jgi:hypothetical protein
MMAKVRADLGWMLFKSNSFTLLVYRHSIIVNHLRYCEKIFAFVIKQARSFFVVQAILGLAVLLRMFNYIHCIYPLYVLFV